MVQSITNQISSQINSVSRLQATSHTPTKAELFTDKFNEHVRGLASGQTESRLSNSGHWAMGKALTEMPGNFGMTQIAPNILKQMDKDPAMRQHISDKIRDFNRKIPNMKHEFSMMGMELTSASLIIHEDGSVSYMTWARMKTINIERNPHEAYIYREQFVFSEDADLSYVIKSMAGLLNSANPGYRRILDLV